MATSTQTILTITQIGANTVQILLVAGLYIAWRQVSVALKDIRTRNEREAGSLAITEADVFAKKLIPQLTELDNKCPDKIFELRGDGSEQRIFRLSEAEGNTIRMGKLEAAKEYLKNNHATAGEIIQFTNELESFAIPFVKKLADECVVYDSLATVYCSSVERYYYFYLLQRRNESRNLYQNTINLYNLWRQKQYRDHLSLRKEQAQNNLENIQRKLQENDPEPELIPIGTNID